MHRVALVAWSWWVGSSFAPTRYFGGVKPRMGAHESNFASLHDKSEHSTFVPQSLHDKSDLFDENNFEQLHDKNEQNTFSQEQVKLDLKILLIDNYDSYTYNLYQYLGSLCVVPPTVIKNDDVLPEEEWDCIVLSPGPGNPMRQEDVGICRDAIRNNRNIPILGVCLGHQLMALEYGGRVELCDPMHGLISTIRLEECALLEGLGDAIDVVRYHSLMASECDDIKGVAWSEEGVMMALEHKKFPHYGVQFHPESIGTHQGITILKNFCQIAFNLKTKYQVHVQQLTTSITSQELFQLLYSNSTNAFWLDSSSTTCPNSRFSIMGDDQGPLAEHIEYYGEEHNTTALFVNSIQCPGNVLDYIESRLKCASVPKYDLPFDYRGGFVGYLGYEAKHLLHQYHHTPKGDPNLPTASFIFADRSIVVDHLTKHVYCVGISPKNDSSDLFTWIRSVEQARPPSRSTPSKPQSTPTKPLKFTPNRSKSNYEENIRQCQHKIKHGESYELCLTNQLVAHTTNKDTLRLYNILRANNPAPFSAFYRIATPISTTSICCSSPERFLRLNQGNLVQSKPIKGTLKRSKDPTTDKLNAERLRTSVKDRAENLMIVDLLRNDLGKVCTIGSVHVPALMDIESFATVHQMVSTVQGRLPPHSNAVKLLKACYPGGSMTGAPKIRSVEILHDLEDAARGVYSGSLGYFSLNGAMDFNIVIRTAVVTQPRDRPSSCKVSIGAGGAITALSDTQDEYEEMLLKASAVVRAVHQWADTDQLETNQHADS